MERKCGCCGVIFGIEDADLALLEKASPSIAGEVLRIPEPKLCPACRQQRRLAFNNEVNLYHRKCSASNSPIISIYSSDKPYPVWRAELWWGHSWDAVEFGRPFDFSRPFFAQFAELSLVVPRPAVQTNFLLDENSAYTNYAGSNKNCYLIFHADMNRDCYYGYGVKKCESCVDVYNTFESELCYECVDCAGSYNLRFAQDCQNCSDSAFLRDCIACRDCLCCKNLQQKRYCVFNRQLSKSDYERWLAEHQLSSYSVICGLKDEFNEFCSRLPDRHLRMYQTEGCFGDHLNRAKDVWWSFDITDARDCRYCYQVYNGARDCLDMYQFGLNSELVYDSSIIGYNAMAVRFSHFCSEELYDLSYCMHCCHGKHLFGCIGVRGRDYCILNQQYTKDEYEELLPRIVAHLRRTGEWGEFFPPALSPFGYNETTALDYFPLDEKQAKKAGFIWAKEQEPGYYQGESFEIPNSITDVPDNVVEKVLSCSVSGRSYKVIPPELEFYRKWGLPVPRRAPSERYRDRLAQRQKRRLLSCTCAQCGTKVLTSFVERRHPKVLCERCYQNALE